MEKRKRRGNRAREREGEMAGRKSAAPIEKESGFKKYLKLLNPRNLEKEVDVYGYHFSWKAHAMLLIGALFGISGIAVLFKLELRYFLVILAAVLLVLPVLVVDMYRRMYEQKRFADAASYMEQMLYSFQKTGKALSALKETRETFSEGEMQGCIDKAIMHMELGQSSGGGGVLEESLSIIGERYRCSKMETVHRLLVQAESFGGDVEDSIALLLEDVENWKKRGYRLQAEKKKSHTDHIISIVVATLLCASALYVLDAMKGLFAAASAIDIFGMPVIQVSSTAFILALLCIYVKSARSMTDDWLGEGMMHEESYIERSYEKVANYDEARERKKSFLLALLPMAAAIAFFALGKGAFGIAGLIVAAICLVQHKIGYHLARKDVTDELYLALPQWLTGMALLLQSNNVQVAIAKSEPDAPVVLRGELRLLLDRLAERPGALSSYTDFCKGFDVPELGSCMKMLHAFSENGTGNVRVQMNHLLSRVGQMQDMADGIRNEQVAYKMKTIFSYPVAAATAKLLVDFSVGMVVMMQMIGNIGGV